MKDHTGRAGLEKDELYAVAREFDEVRSKITVPGAPSRLPGLATASKQPATLTGLIGTSRDPPLLRGAVARSPPEHRC
ncbi:hypothetical protein [Streptomyces sp. NPDC048637]|uniref:hypothetical protein n=1 Tax=Streptomyces sp. NPDC048637 TaxID=3155636 RepID=UPI00343F3AF2